MSIESIPGVQWYMSDDKRSLTVKKDTDYGIKEFTTSWECDPTDDLIAKALKGMLEMMDKNKEDDMIPGQKNKFRKKGNWIFEIATGPPIWWYPHIELKFKKNFLFRIGWIKCAIGIWKATNKEKND
jgi:hypothetical protein